MNRKLEHQIREQDGRIRKLARQIWKLAVTVIPKLYYGNRKVGFGDWSVGQKARTRSDAKRRTSTDQVGQPRVGQEARTRSDIQGSDKSSHFGFADLCIGNWGLKTPSMICILQNNPLKSSKLNGLQMTQLGGALKTTRILHSDHGQHKKKHQLTIMSNFPNNFQQDQHQIISNLVGTCTIEEHFLDCASWPSTCLISSSSSW